MIYAVLALLWVVISVPLGLIVGAAMSLRDGHKNKPV